MLKLTSIFLFLLITLISCQPSKLPNYSNVKNDEKNIIEKTLSSDRKTFDLKFKCGNKFKSITLPKDVEKTLSSYYEEGYFQYFIFSDKSSITILCGDNAVMNSAEENITVDSIEVRPNIFLKTSINKSTKRISQTNDYIQSENVKIKRRKEFENLLVEYIKNEQ